MAGQQSIEDILGEAPKGGQQAIEDILGDASDGSGEANPWGHLSEALNAPVLGFGPELQAAGYAVSHAGVHGGLGQAYQIGLQNFQAQRQRYVEENPLAAAGIDLAGSAIPVTAASMLTPELPGGVALGARARLGSSAVGPALRTARSVARGALLGGEAGALETKLTGGDLGQNTIQGAEIGSALNLAGRTAQAVLGPNGIRLPIHHGRFRGFGQGIGAGLGFYAADKAAEHGLSALGSLLSNPGAAGAAGLAALATATGLGAVRAIRNAARREALGLRGSNWDKVREGALRSTSVNALGGTGQTDEQDLAGQ